MDWSGLEWFRMYMVPALKIPNTSNFDFFLNFLYNISIKERERRKDTGSPSHSLNKKGAQTSTEFKE